MFPKTDDTPAAFFQSSIDKTIPRAITLNFWKPICLIRFVFLAPALPPPISVPKLTVTKDSNSLTDDHEIRFAQDWILFAIANSRSP